MSGMGILENGSDLSERQTDTCLVGFWRIEKDFGGQVLGWRWKGKESSLSATIDHPPSCMLSLSLPLQQHVELAGWGGGG